MLQLLLLIHDIFLWLPMSTSNDGSSPMLSKLKSRSMNADNATDKPFSKKREPPLWSYLLRISDATMMSK